MFSIYIRNQLVDHGWCTGISARLPSFDTDDFDHIEKTIAAMIPLTDICRKDFISLILTLEKFNNMYPNDDNIRIILTKLRQRSSDDL